MLGRALVVLLLVLSVAGQARADLAAVEASESGYATSSPLVAEHVTVDIDCSTEADLPTVDYDPPCRLTATYLIHNPATRPVRVAALAYGDHIWGERFAAAYHRNVVDQRLRVTVDQQPVASGISEQATSALRKAAGARADARDVNWVRKHGFMMTWGADARRVLRISGLLRARSHGGDRAVKPHDGFTTAPLRARHLLLAHRWSPRTYSLRYTLASRQFFANMARVVISVRHPNEWSFSNAEPGWKHRVHRDHGEATRSLRDHRNDVHEPVAIAFELPDPVSPVWHGGPYVGVGGTYPLDGVLVRGGYEFGNPKWLVYSLNVEGHTSGPVLVTPMVEASSDTYIVLIPGVAFGVGIPLQVRPQVTAGVRAQLSLQIYTLGFAVAYDALPDVAHPHRLSLLGRFSL